MKEIPAKIRVLVVDDNVMMQKSIKAFIEVIPELELVGTASNGEEGLVLCGELKPDIVLMDVSMPKMDGIVATRLIHDQHPDVIVIVLTNIQDEEVTRTILEAGATKSLTKGLSVDDLAQTVQQAFYAAHSKKSESDGDNEESTMQDYILIVDDDHDVRRIMTRILEDIGLQTKVAINGQEALTHIAAHPPRLVLLDLMMPLMDGFEVLSRMRANPRTRQIPVVVVTAYNVGDQDLLRLPGVTEVIQKSGFRIAEMQSLVANLIG